MKAIRSFLWRLALALLILHGLLWLTVPPLSAAFKWVKTGEKALPFVLKDMEEKEWRSEEVLKGGVTVLVFWATWSPRSSEILADLEALHAELEPKRFRVVAVNAEHTEFSGADRKAISAMVEELNLSALVLLDHGLVAYNDYGAMALPSSLVINSDGVVTYNLAGYPTTMRSDLSDAVKKALGLPTSVELRPPEGYKPKNHALMYYNFGRRLMEKGQDEKAEAQLLTSVERDPDFVKPRIVLGIYYKKSGRLDEALEQFTKVKELDPSNDEARYQEAAVTLRAAKFPEAEELFRYLHEEFPEREELALGLALALKYQGKQKEYSRIAELAGTLLPGEPRFYYELGSVSESQKDLETTVVLYHRAVEGAFKRRK